MDINPKDLCDIIAAAGKNGVEELNIGDIKISFTKAHQEPIKAPETLIQAPLAPQPLTEHERAEMLRDELDQLMIEDPAAWDKINSGDQNVFN